MHLNQLIKAMCLGFVIGATGPASGGVLTVIQTEVNGASSATNEITLRYEGNRYRMDYSTNFAVLLDGELDEYFQMLHSAKCYVRRPLSEFVAASPCGDAGSSTNAPLPTGRRSEMGDVTVREYQSTNDCGIWTYWVAPDYPGWREMASQLESNLLNSKLGSGSFSLFGKLPGMVVRSEMVATQQVFSGASQPIFETRTNITTLVSAKIVTVDPILMRVPDDYREIESFDALAAPPATDKVHIPAMEEHEALARELNSTNRGAFKSLSMQSMAPFEFRPQDGKESPQGSSHAGTIQPSVTNSGVHWNPGEKTNAGATFQQLLRGSKTPN